MKTWLPYLLFILLAGAAVADTIPAPTGLTASVVNSSQVRLGWNNHASCAAAIVQKSNDGRVFLDYTMVAPAIGVYMTNPLPPGVLYFRVLSVYGVSRSSPSGVMSVTIAPSPTPTPTPVPLVNVEVDISNPAQGYTYSVFWGKNADGSDGIKVDAGTGRATIPNLTIGSTYYFSATARRTSDAMESVKSQAISYVPHSMGAGLHRKVQKVKI